uniref:At1g61320/AtMIF1 LRR domain-containing protein n=1 Tax=Oryza rufipogon TaxID=4529 RepID=A0A0E0QTH2_ORYRU
MSFKDAARAACVSRAFRHSWRCHPNLICCIGILGSDFINKFDRIMKNHSGIGIKSYSFPCSLLADGRASSMRHLYLGNCGFHPTINLDLRNLTRLHLINVHITGDELGCLLSNSHCLEQLELMYCNGIICLKIPSLLQCLSHLEVFDCRILQVQLLLGESLRMKRLSLHYPDAMYYAHAKLPSNAPNLETLTLECSTDKMVDTPILPSKFLHLKCLTIDHTIISSSPAYNYLYLVYFLDACPSLETFLLGISQNHMEHDSIIGDSSHMRQMPGHRHDNLRSVEITGFYSAKSLIELTCYILDNTVALKYLTLDTTRGFFSCSTGEHDRCFPMDKIMITEANRAVLAIQTYIERKVPSTVKLNVVKPCSRCHAVESYL